MINQLQAIPGTPNYLAVLNHHLRDNDITFEEGPHIYTVLGERGTYTSVTTWNHQHFDHFDAETVLNNIMNSKKRNDPTYKYYGMTREEIKTLWENNGASASSAGTNMHYDIECYFNQMNVSNDSVEFNYFLNFVKDFPQLKAYRTEWMIYHEELKLSGSIDMVFENPDGTLQIYDWKRCKEIVHDTDSRFPKYSTTPCISHFPDTNFWHYALQLNIYKMILESKYDKQITDLYLVCIHPDNPYKRYERIQVPILTKEIEDLVQLRLSQLSST